MRFTVQEPRFAGRNLEVCAGGVLEPPRLVVDGVPAQPVRGRYYVTDHAGCEVEIRLLRRGDDPIPDVLIDGAKLPDLLPPFQWYHDLWLWLPFPLLCWLGARGAFVGALAVTANATLFRRAKSVETAYALSALSTLTAVALGYLVTREAHQWVAAWMTWIVVFG
jgi:hypothetical protein